ncbi:transmembrane 7 superfamily member 3 isoform X2 [Hydra vulgaris]|uniref:Transmembrane 7 superfamily member 3 isoform X2 n=1 Tax=Hydra vulgaris TaxID=6087 RepID=A0ABM4CQ21_HYDVU
MLLFFFFVIQVIINQYVDNQLVSERNGIQIELNIPYRVLLSSPLAYHKVNTHIHPKVNYSFMSFQAHTLCEKVVTSFLPYSKYGYENNASDSGIIQMVDNTSVTTYIGIDSNKSEFVEVWLIAIAYKVLSPIPGGCCLTCALNIDPNIHISYDSIQTLLVFERASKSYENTLDPPKCDDSDFPDSYSLTYDVYYLYLESKDYTKEGLYNAISRMTSPLDIKKHGTWLTQITGGHKLALHVQTVFGYGIVFNVIVSDQSHGLFSAYIPAVTYGCKLTLSDFSACIYKSTYGLVLLVILAIFGVVLCFAGFKYFHLFLFTCGTLLFWIISVILIANIVGKIDFKDLLVISSLWSILGGAFFLFLNIFRKCIFISLLCVNIILALIVTSILFYTPFGGMDLWVQTNNFCIAFASIVTFITLVMLFFPKTSCYLCSSIIGSYLVILFANYFLQSSLHFIVQNVMLRLIDYKISINFLNPPFQKNELILVVIWFCLFIIGFFVQCYTTKKLPFNRHPVVSSIPKKSKNTKTISLNNERTPLCKNEQPVSRSYSTSSPPPDYFQGCSTAPFQTNAYQNPSDGVQSPVNPYWNQVSSFQPLQYPVNPS